MPSLRPTLPVLSQAERVSLEALSPEAGGIAIAGRAARVVLACAEQGDVTPLTKVMERTGM